MSAWKHELSSLIKKIQVLRLILEHPCTPIRAKVVTVCGLGYVVSPIQLIPTFIPVVGQIDDLFIVLLATALVYRVTPLRIVKECEQLADSEVLVLRLKQSLKKPLVKSTEGS